MQYSPHGIFDTPAAHAPQAVDAVIKDFTLKGFSHIPHTIRSAGWRIIADSDICKSWHVLSSDKEYKHLNCLMAPHWAKECLTWLNNGQVKLRHTTINRGREFILFNSDNSLHGIFAPSLLSASGVGAAPHVGFFEEPEPMDEGQTLRQKERFDNIWNTATLHETEHLKEKLEFLSTPHPAEWVYMKACQIFVPDTDVQDDYLDDPPGYTDTAIWRSLFDFQKDGVKGVINKILKYNGCILADSVGLGKTYEALAVIKYFARRGDRVLVLTPKRLRDNWSLFTANDERNPFSDDPFHYDLLNHTDIGRSTGKSGDTDLSHFRWSNFDLIVIDESHNFRNHKGSRYQRLLEEVVKKGTRTKLLLLTATPVNNRVADLRNQINLLAHGNDSHLSKHGVESITETSRKAQKKFADWARIPEEERACTSLIRVLGQNYIHLLDLLTIARSRKHITENYHTVGGTGMFPTRRRPINCYPEPGDSGFLPVQEISKSMQKLKMAVYRPMHYVLPHCREKYARRYNQQLGINREFSQIDREKSLSALMTVNLLKRMESSVQAFDITLNKQINATRELLNKLNTSQSVELIDGIEDDDSAEMPEWLGSAKIHIDPQDMDTARWSDDLKDDLQHLKELNLYVDAVRRVQDSKLKQLRKLIEDKIAHPINHGNRKVIIFTAFADTATYIYEQLSPQLLSIYGIHSALVSGSKRNRCTLPGLRLDQDSLLSAFSPRSKSFDLSRTKGKEIDILIATDCISEGQNLQDCDFLINADIHWNPVRLIQRFGRIDRIGSTNAEIQMVNMWPVAELNEYINLEQRVKDKMDLLSSSATGHDNLLNDQADGQQLEFRSRQLLKLKDEVISLEDVAGNASLTNLNFQQQRSDLQNFRLSPQKNRPENWPSYLGAVCSAAVGVPAGAFFLLKSHSNSKADKTYPYAPYYLLHVEENGTVSPQFRDIKEMLSMLQVATLHHSQVVQQEQQLYDKRTRHGSEMTHYTRLLSAAVRTLIGEEKESVGRSFFSAGKSLLGRARTARGVDDVEVITWLAILP